MESLKVTQKENQRAAGKSRRVSRKLTKSTSDSDQDDLEAVWNGLIEDYEIFECLGQGSFGRVMKARHRQTQTDVAIKLLKNCFQNQYEAKKLVSEIQIMRKLTACEKNCYTTRIFDVIAPEFNPKCSSSIEYIFIVMEFEESDLKQVLNACKSLSFSEEHMIILMYNLLCSMNFVHTANIMHRDIKPANILIDMECRPKICDFGLARSKPKNQTYDDMDKYIQANLRKYRNSLSIDLENATDNQKNSKRSKTRERRFRSNMNVTNVQLDPSNSKQTIDQRSQSPNSQLQNSQKKAQNDQEKLNNQKVHEKVKRLIISDRLINDRKERKQKKRSLSNHVVSRYYRAPEIILLEKEYTQKVDMWSIGCIFAEMLHCLEPANQNKVKEQNRILFPGNSCYPLSPDGHCEPEDAKLDNVDGSDVHISSRDQIKYICRTMGTPQQSDMSFITDDSALSYLELSCAHRHKSKLEQLFPSANAQVLSLLKGLLEFNPYNRLSAHEALQHSLFDSVRQPYFEKPCPFQINQSIYSSDAFDYETFEHKKYSIQDYKKMLQSEQRKVRECSMIHGTGQ